MFTLPLLLATAAAGYAGGQITAPPQPTSGPGGNAYPYLGVNQFGPFTANSATTVNDFYVYQPAGATVESLPAVIFLHGYLLKSEGSPIGDDPSNYQGWINHLAQMGYTVIFPTDFDSTPGYASRIPNVIADVQAAIALMADPANGMLPVSTDSVGSQLVCAGHSFGAHDCFLLAQALDKNTPPFPAPRAIAAFNPYPGPALAAQKLVRLLATTYVVLVKSDEEVPLQAQAADNFWTTLQTLVSTDQMDYLEVVTDKYGTPAQLGNHCWPMTNGFKDDTTIDDRDFNVSYKLSVGLFNCVLYGTDCTYGLGHGDQDQIDMGLWSDGTPVLPLTWIPPAGS